jgi:hypothetical protein
MNPVDPFQLLKEYNFLTNDKEVVFQNDNDQTGRVSPIPFQLFANSELGEPLSPLSPLPKNLNDSEISVISFPYPEPIEATQQTPDKHLSMDEFLGQQFAALKNKYPGFADYRYCAVLSDAFYNSKKVITPASMLKIPASKTPPSLVKRVEDSFEKLKSGFVSKRASQTPKLTEDECAVVYGQFLALNANFPNYAEVHYYTTLGIAYPNPNGRARPPKTICNYLKDFKGHLAETPALLPVVRDQFLKGNFTPKLTAEEGAAIYGQFIALKEKEPDLSISDFETILGQAFPFNDGRARSLITIRHILTASKDASMAVPSLSKEVTACVENFKKELGAQVDSNKKKNKKRKHQ